MARTVSGAWLGFVLVDAAGVIAATATANRPSGRPSFSVLVPEGRYTLRAAAIDAVGGRAASSASSRARLAGTTELASR